MVTRAQIERRAALACILRILQQPQQRQQARQAHERVAATKQRSRRCRACRRAPPQPDLARAVACSCCRGGRRALAIRHRVCNGLPALQLCKLQRNDRLMLGQPPVLQLDVPDTHRRP